MEHKASSQGLQEPPCAEPDDLDGLCHISKILPDVITAMMIEKARLEQAMTPQFDRALSLKLDGILHKMERIRR